MGEMKEFARIPVNSGKSIFYDRREVVEKKEKFGLTFFIDERQCVREYKTGKQICQEGKTPKESWYKAFNQLDKYGEEFTKSAIEEHLMKHGMANISKHGEGDKYEASADAYYKELSEDKKNGLVGYD